MTNEVTAARYETVLRLRREGSTFREIGNALGVNSKRAAQLHYRALIYEARMVRWSWGTPTLDTPIDRLKLSDRTYLALVHAGYKILSDLMPLDRAKEVELIGVPNFGTGGIGELQAVIDSL